jgi:hypothetical protein
MVIRIERAVEGAGDPQAETVRSAITDDGHRAVFQGLTLNTPCRICRAPTRFRACMETRFRRDPNTYLAELEKACQLSLSAYKI